ncbi:WSC domain-containing protein [Lactarius quietus]|nr:WSC domain-containing protein [Lactarius quietus]
MYPNWQLMGCRSDLNLPLRALNTEVTVPGGLSNASVENCIGECKSLQFVMAGMEQKTCWCGNEITPGTGTQIATSSCNTPCTGDSNEICGGPQALLVYYVPNGI